VTVTVNRHVLEFPLASVAVTVTVVVPTGKSVPDAGLALTTGEASQLSVAVGSVNVTRALLLEVHTATFAGHVTDGAIVSTTFTVRIASVVLPLGSLTV
jgi:hypothetical protein